MTESAVARLRGILARDMTAAAIDQLLDQVTVELIQAAGDQYVQAIRAQAVAAIEQERTADPEQPIPYALTEPARCCMCGSADVRYRNYREQPFCWPCADGTSPEGKAAVAASLAEPNPVVRAADQPQPAVAGSRASEIYTGPGSVGDVLARAFRATYERGPDA